MKNATKKARIKDWGQQFETEFDAISTAVATKADLASPTFTGTVTIPALAFTGTLSTGTIDGGTY
jgi:hypothetical protein